MQNSPIVHSTVSSPLVSKDTMERSSDDHMVEICLFLIFALWFVEVKIVGRLFLVEIIYLAIAVRVLLTDFNQRILSSTFMKRLLILWLCWFIVQMLTDWYRGTPFFDYARGWAKIFFFGTNTIALYALIRNEERRLILFLAASAVGGILKTFFIPSKFFVGGSMWKFGFGGAVVMLLILVSMRLRRWIYAPLMLIALGILNLFFDYRSLALCCIGAATITFIAHFYQFAKEKFVFEGKLVPRIPTIIMIICVGFTALWYFYGLSGRYDIGINVGQRHLKGDARNPLYGRLMIVSGIRAVLDSPIIGYGSWARDMKYVYYLEGLKARLGLTGGPITSDLIPTHSFIIGGWVEAGIVGGIFWIFVFYHTVKALIWMVLYNFQLTPVFSFLLIGFCWTIWFSPFAFSGRITVAFKVVLLGFILGKEWVTERECC